MDQDTRAVINRLDRALTDSGLSLRQFASTLGTSPSRFSAYRSGHTAPSARFLLRAERIANALHQAHALSIPTSLDAAHALGTAAGLGDDDRTHAVALEARDRVRALLRHHRNLAAAWEAQPPAVEPRWDALTAALVGYEFTQAGLDAPLWTVRPRLAPDWVLDTPRLTEAQIREQTPAWLSERGIFVAEKDLLTV